MVYGCSHFVVEMHGNALICMQNLRSATKTSNKVNAAQFVDIMRAYHRGLTIAGSQGAQEECSMPVMKAKRGMPKSRDRVDAGWDSHNANWLDEEVSLGVQTKTRKNIVLYYITKYNTNNMTCHLQGINGVIKETYAEFVAMLSKPLLSQVQRHYLYGLMFGN